ncbi:PREDICTED: TONSOKU [Prunus dulcis]|uniref:PREDICTED: TONSOKU n=1 Tax=Prunus dulcis TaxID=3755 RepID=A0A5E4FX74_PRUDU|nr:PREDICTED: TONSOKU [Prunus dulcis]
MLSNSQCCLKVLVLQRCELGVAGVLRISFLEELNLADNANLWRYRYPRKLILLNRVQQLGLNLVIVKMMKLELKLLHLVSMTAAKCRGIVFCIVKIKIWFSSEAYQGPDNPFVLKRE